MSMPFNTNPEKIGPIKVYEDDTHFLVHIHPGNRDRAKKIDGRQWDGNRKAWVYPKDSPTYEALVEEFQKDADSFDIRRPKTKRPPGIKPPAEETDDDEFEDQYFEEIPSLGRIDESQGRIYSGLEEIQVMLQSLRDVASHQSRTLEELCETQKETKNTLTKSKSPIQQLVKTKTVEVLPDSLDLTKQKEIELLEKALIRIACLTANEQKTFCDWVSKHEPLDRPRDFVSETHEFLKEQLGKIVEDEDPDTDFYVLIQKAKNENLIYSDRFDPVKPIPLLKNLNAIRNRFIHPRGEFSSSERWSRSILYLMNLALVWSRVVIETEEENE